MYYGTLVTVYEWDDGRCDGCTRINSYDNTSGTLVVNLLNATTYKLRSVEVINYNN